VQGFRKQQDDELRTAARELAAKVQASGEDEEMGPLNPYARRIVHLAVAENPAVTTESFGEDLLKTVVISVKRA
jgi:spoIIIJ-associated protein